MCHVCDKKNEHLQHDSRKRSFMKLVAASALGLGISGAGVARAEETKQVPHDGKNESLLERQPQNSRHNLKTCLRLIRLWKD